MADYIMSVAMLRLLRWPSRLLAPALLLAILPRIVTAELTEAEAVAAGLVNPNIAVSLEARLSEAEGRLHNAGRWDNPSVEYVQENLDLAAGRSREANIWLRQRINLAGVKGLEKKAARWAYAATASRVELAEWRWKRVLRGFFYETLAARQQADLLHQQCDRLQTIADMVQQRVHQGDASQFDALRIQQELAVLSNQHQQALAQLHAKQAALFNLLNQSPEPLSGTVLPPAITRSAFNVDHHPQLQALDAEQLSAQTRAKAARREQWPELTLGIGRKTVNEPGLDVDGHMFSLGVEIPLFNRGRARVRISQSRAQRLQADEELLRSQLLSDYQATEQAYRLQHDSAVALQALMKDGQTSLSALAEARYQAGELNVMGLLDAYRSDLATRRQAMNAAMDARRSYIQLQLLKGE